MQLMAVLASRKLCFQFELKASMKPVNSSSTEVLYIHLDVYLLQEYVFCNATPSDMQSSTTLIGSTSSTFRSLLSQRMLKLPFSAK